MKKTALVLSGGGFKGAFQLGALGYLKENWSKIVPGEQQMKFNVVAGVSVGSLNGLLIALKKFEDLEKLWKDVGKNGESEIYTSDFIDTKADDTNPDADLKLSISWETIKNRFPNTTKNILLRFLFNKNAFMTAFKKDFANFKAIADNTPLRDKIFPLAKRSEIKDCVYKCGYVSLDDGLYYSFRHSDFSSDTDFANAVLASTSMPIIWPPVLAVRTSDGVQKNTVDGGVRNISPLGDVIHEILDDSSSEEYTIVIINCSSGLIAEDSFDNKNIAQIALRALDDIAITEIFNNDLQEFIDKNYILQQVREKLPGVNIFDYDFKNRTQGKVLKHFNAIIIQPDGTGLGDPLIANEQLINRRINMGREKAAEALELFSKDQRNLKFTIV